MKYSEIYCNSGLPPHRYRDIGLVKLNISVSLWNYIHYFPLRKGGTSFSFEGGLDSLERVVAEAVSAGYGIELWPSWHSWEWTSPEREAMVSRSIDLYAEEHRERLAAMLRGVRSSWHTDGDNTLVGYQRKIDMVAAVGSSVLVAHAANLFLDGPEPDFDFAADVLRYAGEKGVKIALENASEGEQDDDPTLWNLALMKRAIARFDELGICLDTTHVQKFKRNPMSEYVDALAARICHLHISDALGDDVGVGRLHTQPGTGTIPVDDWLYLLDSLERAGFAGEAVLEIKPLTPVRIAQQTETFFSSLGADG